MPHILECIEVDSEKSVKASKNLKELKMKFPFIKSMEKQMEIEFNQQKQQLHENYGSSKYKRQSKLAEKQFCKFQICVDRAIKNSQMKNKTVLVPTKMQGQFLMVRPWVAA